MHIFIDSSVNHTKNQGVGCYLILDNLNYNMDLEADKNIIKNKLQHINLHSNSSTLGELETFKYILSLEIIQEIQDQINIYTDCNNIAKLFNDKSYSADHKHAVLYGELLNKMNQMNINIIKTKGHLRKRDQITIIQKIFGIVDRTARKQLKNNIRCIEIQNKNKL